MPAPECQKSFVLTVAESKRLIALGIKRHPAVLRALSQGTIAVAKGTTNSYIVEELTGESIHRPDYCTGVTRPARGGSTAETSGRLPDLVLRQGRPVEGLSAVEAVAEMGPGDVFIKGANALNYERRQAGILIGHPTGGTIGAALGTLVARRALLLIPVGLEKSIPADLVELHAEMARIGPNGAGPMLWPVGGEIFTEIEAIQLISGARAVPIAAGGIGGAEGSVRLGVWGTPDQVQRAEEAIELLLGEPPFLPPPPPEP